MYRTHKQPVGHATRGKTAPLRLRRLDRYLVTEHPGLFRRAGGAFVDLGYGANPTTTLEAAERFRRLNPGLPVVGLEIDPVRVEAAAYANGPRTRFARGGFDLPLLPGESVRLLRAMNVLRQYDEDVVERVHAELIGRLEPGGLLVEGTSTPSGHRMVVNLLDAREHTVVFCANLRHPLDEPWNFTAILPKNLIHRVRPGEPVHDLLEGWREAWRTTHHAATFGPLAHWCAAGDALAAARSDVVRRPGLLRRGYLLWRP